MAIDLVNYLSSNSEEQPLLWADFNSYTKKLLLGAGQNPWTTPAEYVSYYSQAHSLVKSDVVILDLWDLCSHWIREDETAIPSMAGKRRVTHALSALLGSYAIRELLAEVIMALANKYGGTTPIVLVMPSPRNFVTKADGAANARNTIPDENNIDAASVYIADFLRYFSETGISGVLLEEDPENLPNSATELSWYQPIYNVAKHYRWAVGINTNGIKKCELPEGAAFIISSAADEGCLGLNISNELWNNSSQLNIPKCGFVYLSIPEDENPEYVLEKISNLKR